MRIGIDARCLEGKRTGEGRYLVNLLKQWSNDSPENEYLLYFRLECAKDDFLEQECFSLKRLIVKIKPRELIWQHVCLPRQVRADNIDVLLCPSYTTPLYCKKKTVVTIHDISYEVNPDWYPLRSQIRLRPFSYIAAKTSNLILTVSEFSKTEIITHYHVPEKKVKVTYEAADPRFKEIKDQHGKIQRVKRKYNIQSDFIFYLGAIVNRRNIDKLLDAFKKLCGKISGYQLVIVGVNCSYPYIDINSLIKKNGLSNAVLYFEYMKEEDILLLYNAATLFIWLSIYEGFGLPLLEAMACGTPVITTNCASIPEVVGDAALLVNPLNSDEIMTGMERILSDLNLREYLSQKGLHRVKLFSWEKCAKETLQALKEVHDGE
jgi:glycosyltransferase involved in cell wall biosynthesis